MITKKFKNNIIIGLSFIIFICSGILYYCSILKAENSFIKLNTLSKSKIELQKGDYNLYGLNLNSNIQKDLKVTALENKTHDTLNISLIKEKKFIWSSQTIVMRGNVYDFLTNIKIPKKGNYNIAVKNPHKIKIQFAIQNQNDDKTFLKSMFLYYLLSVISLGVVIIMLLVIIIKSVQTKFRNKNKLI